MNLKQKAKIKRTLIDSTFLFPALAVFIAFVVAPFIWGIPLSLTDWDGLSATKNYVGLKNYFNMFSDAHILNAFKNTGVFAVMTLVLSNIFGLAIALLLQRSNKLNNITRTMVFMPYCLSMILQSYIWKYMYSDVLTGLLQLPNPLGSQFWAIFGISFICIWADTGYCMIIYVAALQGIPRDYYEVAEISGATRWQQFCKITLPMLWPAVVSNVIIYLGWGLKVYDYPMAATSGGPGRASETVAMLIYKNLFSYHKAGYGQALAVVYTILIFVIISVVAKVLRRREVEL